MDKTNQQLLQLLTENARESTSSLARKLNLSRTAVQERINKLESSGIIAGYTVKLNHEYEKRLIKAWVTLKIKQKLTNQVVADMKRIEEVKCLRAINGNYDLIASITAETTESIDKVLDKIGSMEGVVQTISAIELSVRFDR